MGKHRRVTPLIWDNPEWRKLSSAAQWAYFMVLTQKDLSNCGTVVLNPYTWAKRSSDTSVEDVLRALHELQDARFVYFDEDTDEVLVRTYIRNDGIDKQPNMLRSACKDAVLIASAKLRTVLHSELSKISISDGKSWKDAAAIFAETVAQLAPVEPFANPSRTLPEGFAEPLSNPSGDEITPVEPFAQVDDEKANPSPNPSGTLREPLGNPSRTLGGRGGGYCSSNLKVKDAREENPGQDTPSAEHASPSNDSFNESKTSDDAFTRFCEALPKPPRTGLAQVRMKWQAACVEHQGWRVLEAAKAYGKKFESDPEGTTYAKQAVAFLASEDFEKLLPHRMQAYRGMDLEKWLDMVTEQRDTGTVYRYAGGETFFPRLPDNYLKLSDAEKATEMAIAKDAWFREHRDEHLKNLRIRYGVITDVA